MYVGSCLALMEQTKKCVVRNIKIYLRNECVCVCVYEFISAQMKEETSLTQVFAIALLYL